MDSGNKNQGTGCVEVQMEKVGKIFLTHCVKIAFLYHICMTLKFNKASFFKLAFLLYLIQLCILLSVRTESFHFVLVHSFLLITFSHFLPFSQGIKM